MGNNPPGPPYLERVDPDALLILVPSVQDVSGWVVGAGIERDGGDVNLESALPQYRPDMCMVLAPMPQAVGVPCPRIDVDERAGAPPAMGSFKGKYRMTSPAAPP